MWVPVLLLSLSLASQLFSLSDPGSSIFLLPRTFSSVATSFSLNSISVWLKTTDIEAQLFAIKTDQTCIVVVSKDHESCLKAKISVESYKWTQVETYRSCDNSWKLIVISVATSSTARTVSLCRASKGYICAIARSAGNGESLSASEGYLRGVGVKVYIGEGESGSEKTHRLEGAGFLSDFRLYINVSSERELIRWLLSEWSRPIAENIPYEKVVLSKELKAPAVERKWILDMSHFSQFFSLKLTASVKVLDETDTGLLEIIILLGSENIFFILEQAANSGVKLCMQARNGKQSKVCSESKLMRSKDRFSIAFCLKSTVPFVSLCIGPALSTKEECVFVSVSDVGKTSEIASLEVSLPATANSQVSDLSLIQSQLCSSPALQPQVSRSKPRSLQSTLHYSQFSYRQYINQGESYYYTFENNHLGTRYIFAELDDLGSGGDPDLVIEKPYGGPCSWGAGAVGPDSLTITSSDAQIVAQGGSMQGSYTVRVYGFSGSFEYEIRITVACADTSGGCFCPSGLYANPSTSSCSLCPADALCLAAENSGCVQLTLDTFSIASVFNCYKCDPLLYACACHHSCPSCSGSANTDCTACYANAGLVGSSPSACACAQGFYPDPDPSACQPCHSYCLDCVSNTDTSCTGCKTDAQLSGSAPNSCQCKPGFLGAPDSCQPCDSTCGTCSAVGPLFCDSCKAGGQLVGLAPPSSCECAPGYFIITDASNCQPCHSTCKLCSTGGASNCSDCYTNASLTATPPASCACVAGYYGSAESCQACVSPCVTCSGGSSASCLSCPANAILNGASPNSCVCSSGYYPNPDLLNCALCQSYCKTCQSGSSSGCMTCWVNASLVGSAPNSCACVVPYTGSPDSCQSCDSSCATCSGTLANQCQSCKAGASLSSTAPSACVCSNGYYGSPASCSACDATCLTCSAAGSSSCISCKSNASSSSGVCTCVGGFYPNTTSANCAACGTTCQTCTDGFATSCTGCKSNAYLPNGSPGPCACTSGYYPNTDASNCQICSSLCLTCSSGSPSGCTGCKTLASLSAGSPSACLCTSGSFPNPDVGTCASCDPTCLECSGLTAAWCTQCKTLATLSGTSPSACVCVSSAYPSLDPSNCLSCSSLCLTCVGGLSSDCINCHALSHRVDTVNPSACECDIGYYGLPNNCLQCDATCKSCGTSGALSCTDCKVNAHLNGAAPIDCLCNDGFFPNTTPANCSPCDSTCAKCVAGTSSDCTDCTPNAALVGGVSPGTCACNGGYYPNTTPANCSKCDITCKTCSGKLNSDCTLCFPNANFKGGASPDMCLCDGGFFPNPSTDICQPCDVSCLDCVGGNLTQCSSCKPNATLESGASVGKCLCDSGFFPDPTAGHCTPCDATCKECQGATVNDCTECKDFAKLAGSVPCACLCSPEAFPSPDASKCRVCSLECLTCVDDGPAKCLTCKSAASLLSTAPSECVCDSGFYPSPDASLCAPCNPACGKCSNGFECSMCKGHASLKEGNCFCDNGYFGNPDASLCVPCPDGCLSCAQTGCLKCKPSYYLYTESCVIECPFGYRATPTFECSALDLSPPVPSLTVTTENILSVFFSKAMNCTLQAGDIGLDVKTTSGIDVSFTWSDPNFQSEQNLLIAMDFESAYLPSGSTVGLTFISPEKVTDIDGIPIDITYLQGELTSFGSSKSNSTGVLLQTQAAQTTAAASRGGVSAGAASSLLNGNPACLMSLVNQLQLISYISMTKLPLPQDFASTLAALNVGQMLPNPFSNVFPSFSQNDTSQDPPQYVKDYGIETALFLPNSLTFLGTICAILLSFIPIYFLSKVKVRFIANYFKKMLPSLRWNVPLQLWLTSYLDLGVFSLLQIKNVNNSMHSAYTGFSLVLGAAFCFCFSLTPFLLVAFTVRNFNLISSRSDPLFNRRWGSLFLPFKSDYNFSTIAYFSLFVLRRAILAVSLVLFPDSLAMLALLNTSCCLTVMATQVFLYIVVCRPFAAKIDQIDAATVETSTFLVYLAASSFLLDLSTSVREMISSFGVWLVRIAIFMNVGVSVFRTVLNIIDLVKLYGETMKAAEARYKIHEVEQICRGDNDVTSMRDTRSTVTSYMA